LWSRYGISLQEYRVLLKAQGGRCALCGKPPGKTALHVDHSHELPYAVRGLLCYLCNKHKVGALTVREVDLVSGYLHNPPAYEVLGVRPVPLGMEAGERRRKRRSRKVVDSG
jgi:hypothetical protein